MNRSSGSNSSSSNSSSINVVEGALPMNHGETGGGAAATAAGATVVGTATGTDHDGASYGTVTTLKSGLRPRRPGAIRGSSGSLRWSCDAYSLDALTRVKPIQQVMRERTAEERQATQMEHEKGEEEPHLTKTLGVLDLMGYGIGCTVGAGIYSLIGPGVKIAGPAILISFVIGAVACIFTGLAYSEFAARVPIAGSAYTYAYTSFGEFPVSDRIVLC